MELSSHMMTVLTTSTVPGLCGGFGLFLYSLRNGHYKNNKYTVKLLVELLGATVVASFLGPLFPEKAVIIASFLLGLSWAWVIQASRSKITKVVMALIGEELR